MRTEARVRRTWVPKQKEENDSEVIELGSQHLADNESIHGSMKHSYDNIENVVSMVIQDNLPVEDLQEIEEKAT